VEGEEGEDMNQGGMGRKEREEGKDRINRKGERPCGKARRWKGQKREINEKRYIL
jgi:hypothetical protein